MDSDEVFARCKTCNTYGQVSGTLQVTGQYPCKHQSTSTSVPDANPTQEGHTSAEPNGEQQGPDTADGSRVGGGTSVPSASPSKTTAIPVQGSTAKKHGLPLTDPPDSENTGDPVVFLQALGTFLTDHPDQIPQNLLTELIGIKDQAGQIEAMFRYFTKNPREIPAELCVKSKEMNQFRKSLSAYSSSQRGLAPPEVPASTNKDASPAEPSSTYGGVAPAVPLPQKNHASATLQQPGIKNNYLLSFPDGSGGFHTRYSEYPDPEIEKEQLRLKSANGSIVQWLRPQAGSLPGAQKWEAEEIHVQSSPLKNILASVLSGYPDFVVKDRTPLKFKWPFKPMFHKWKRMIEYKLDAKGLGNRAAAGMLIQVFEPVIDVQIKRLQEIRQSMEVVWDDLWLLFGPEEQVVINLSGMDVVCKVVCFNLDTTFNPNEPRKVVVHVNYVDWNGSHSCLQSEWITITEYGDARSLMALPVRPLWLFDSVPNFRLRLVERGRAFERLRGSHHMMCRDRMLVTVQGFMGPQEEWRPVSGKVMIDAHAYYKCQDKIPGGSYGKIQGRTSKTSKRDDKLDLYDEDWDYEEEEDEEDEEYDEDDEEEYDEDEEEDEEEWEGENEHRSGSKRPRQDHGTTNQIKSSDQHKGGRKVLIEPLTEEECLMASPFAKGFDLKSKKWGKFPVDSIEEISWNDQIFDNLVLPIFTKNVVKACVNSKKAGHENFEDFVSEKGRGFIFLLFGPPGVGKTLTVEAVAETAKLPLYLLSAAELGTEPHTVGTNLAAALKCCELWGAVLLIDEADVFLSTRSTTNLKQNELISIFLRYLEYYQGLMFLTTNRAKTIDPAFRSRVDTIIHFPDLDVEARCQVWKNFIAHIGPDKFEMSDPDIAELSKVPVNGREIKGLLKSALRMAFHEGQKKPAKIVANTLQQLASMRLETEKVYSEE